MHIPLLAKRWLQGALAAAALFTATAGSLFAQGLTTSGVNGLAVDDRGAPVNGARVTIVHLPTNSTSEAITGTNGRFSFTGLRPGGPYNFTGTAEGFAQAVVRDVFLTLGEDTDVRLVMGTEVIRLAEFAVTGTTTPTIFDAIDAGSGSFFTAGQIAARGSARRNIQDIATVDSRLALQSGAEGPQLVAQGQNIRFNSFMVDGVRQNDTFGLNDSGVATRQTSPVPLEAVQALSVELTPYDVTRAGFTGALINAITKSGGNVISGSLYTYYSDANLRGKNPVSRLKDTFLDKTFGGTIGGPIIENKLFFFLSYEEKSVRQSAPAAWTPRDSDLQQILTRLAAVAPNYDPGVLSGPGDQFFFKSKQWTAKIDWDIAPGHRLAFTASRNDVVEPAVGNTFRGTATTSFSNHWFDNAVKQNNYILRANNQWTPDFSTEVTLSYSDYDGTPINRGADFPMVTINGIPGTTPAGTPSFGQIRFGTELSRQLNRLFTETRSATGIARWVTGDHTVTFGAEVEKFDALNFFTQNIFGNYTFGTATINGAPIFATPGGTAASYVLVLPAAVGGYPPADWSYTMTSVFLQDRWQMTDRLTLLGGFRLDMPSQEKPLANDAVFSAFGVRTDTSMTGNTLLSPRFSFIYSLGTEHRTNLRGGMGLFQGRNPAVWLSNNYSNTGLPTLATPTFNAPANTQVFNPNPYGQTGTAGAARFTINTLNDKFRMPSLWKGNLALDHELPWLGLIASLEVNASFVENGIYYEHLNLVPVPFTSTSAQVGTGTAARTVFTSVTAITAPTLHPSMPDGRIRYAGNITGPGQPTSILARNRQPGFGDVLILSNTSKGRTYDGTLKVERPMRDGWAASLAYTYTDATEVSPSTSSVAASNYINRAWTNPNEEVASTANYEVRHRFVGTAMYRFEVLKKAPTTVSATWTSRIGRPFSYVFVGDGNGDGYAGQDLFYVPRFNSDGTLNDPRVRFGAANPTGAAAVGNGNNLWIPTGGTPAAGGVGGLATSLTADQQRAAFWQFLQGSGLRNYMGEIAPRNAFNSPWVHTLDMAFVQEIPIYERTKVEFFVNLNNVGNMIDSSWGRTEEVGFPLNRGAAAVAFDPTANSGAGQYVYGFDPGRTPLLQPALTTVEAAGVSRWSVLLGARVSF